MPCFHNLRDDEFTPIGARERAFIEALVALAPETLAPVLTQLDNARTCDDGTGWLVIRDARGEPCELYFECGDAHVIRRSYFIRRKGEDGEHHIVERATVSGHRAMYGHAPGSGVFGYLDAQETMTTSAPG